MAEQNVITRVMKLMERANHPTTPEHEAILCMEKAESLMAQHKIDQMDLTPEEKSKIVKDTWEVNTGDAGSEFSYHVESLVQTVLKHCNVRIHPRVQYVRNADGFVSNYNMRAYTLIGYPEDIFYAEQIWFNVFEGFVCNVSPKWDVSLLLSENVYHFIKAGYSWIDTYRIGRKTQYSEWPTAMPNGAPLLRKAYKEALEKRGEEWSKTKRREAYRNNFVQSYTSTIRQRLTDLRQKGSETVSDSDKFALALVDTKERVDAEFYRLYPEYDPETIRKEAAEADFLRACEWAALTPEEQAKVLKDDAKAEAAWQRRMRRARANYGRVREAPKDRYDPDAWERGRQVANKVKLSVDAEVKKGPKGEIK